MGRFVEFIYENSLFRRENDNVAFVIQSFLNGRECRVKFLNLSCKRLGGEYKRRKGGKVVNKILLFSGDHSQRIDHFLATFGVRGKK